MQTQQGVSPHPVPEQGRMSHKKLAASWTFRSSRCSQGHDKGDTAKEVPTLGPRFHLLSLSVLQYYSARNRKEVKTLMFNRVI